MKLTGFIIVLLAASCSSRSVFDDEDADSVVSVYTTQPTTAGTTAPLDVYSRIATNIAQRITSPIYRFLGYGKNKTEDANVTTKKPWDKIELLDDNSTDSKTNLKPIDNDISDRDVEEVSPEAAQHDTKPEKITLYSSYLPAKGNLEINDTINEISDDDTISFDDFDDDKESETPREGYVYFLEWIGTLIQLAIGAFTALFKPADNS